MRITMLLAAAAILGTTMLGGSANATALMDRPAAAPSATVAPGPACPSGWHWDPAHYNHLGQYESGRCIRG